MKITPEELVLFGLAPGSPLPQGGKPLVLTLRSNSGSAQIHTDRLAPMVRTLFGIELYPGSLNLWSEAPLEWERPMPVSTGDYPAGQFCPVILEEVAVGLAFRANSDTPTFLEVLSPVCLREHISNRHDGASIPIRLLAGSELRPRTK